VTAAEKRCLGELDLDGKTVFDIGGFRGTHALFFARRVGESGRVITFEPHPENCAEILAELARSGVSNVELRSTAIGCRNEMLEFAYPDDRGLGSAHPGIKARLFRDEQAQPVTIEVQTLDSEIAAGQLPEPDFVKIDVEGMELDVLHGMRDTASRRKPALFVEIHGVDAPDEEANARRVIGWLIECGYRITHVSSGQPIPDLESARRVHPGQHVFCV
jgi:FkbM family methyltransferase